MSDQVTPPGSPFRISTPKAPTKKKPSLVDRRGLTRSIPKFILPDKPKPEWQLLAESGRVREKFLRWTPEDVEEMDDRGTLECLKDLYSPLSQPQNYLEEAYLLCILDAVTERLAML